MQADLLYNMLERFSLFESLLVLALWKCLREIQGLYLEKISDKEKDCQDLKPELERSLAFFKESQKYIDKIEKPAPKNTPEIKSDHD